ncbi:VOC family protein [Bradyrhizobium stylosanthis]|uniref:Glyoxalase/bleomycin resistance protein/dioxygenase superfamily protein n=1 Tax=Bradyrhizobium stylosanthis TaxID=1803665 RepID=A0A560DZ99_9BRAD|nr:VOC family protein [Bradyrhizobium stylosanthis]TWB02432.1 glyoxalase/bleomycin resistance protein/dioxygenase superfamily protein [Bradyrhizobium stylosanthis]
MKIVGPDELVFGVDSVEACAAFIADFGLKHVGEKDGSGLYEALDGTGLSIYPKGDPSLPPPLPTGNMLRRTIYGVEDQQTLDQIKDELSKDRQVQVQPDGTVEAVDDLGFALGFRITRRRKLNLLAERINSPGAAPQRGFNEIGANEDAAALPRTLSHVVYFVPDAAKMEAFYIQRLGFTVMDRFTGGGPFLRPASNTDHHTLFLIQTPEYMKGIEHFAFHMQGPTELMLAGSRMVKKGYQSFWGPGRHKFGSNWFWYFNSPMGTHAEFDADMDVFDDKWEPRVLPMRTEHSQIFLLEHREKWAPGG